MTLSFAEGDVLAALEEARRCETPSEECAHAATWIVWIEHHKQGCPADTYRCDVHFNLLILEAQRLVASIRCGRWINCGWCGVLLTSQTLSDYVRGIRL